MKSIITPRQRVRVGGRLGVVTRVGGIGIGLGPPRPTDGHIWVQLDGQRHSGLHHPDDVTPVPSGLGRWDAGWPPGTIPYCLGDTVITDGGRGRVVGAYAHEGIPWVWVSLPEELGLMHDAPYRADEVVAAAHTVAE